MDLNQHCPKELGEDQQAAAGFDRRKLLRTMQLHLFAADVFGGVEPARMWLRKPHPALNIQAGTAAVLGEPADQRPGLMSAMDRLNDRFGRGSVALSSAGLAGDRRSWVMKQDFKAPNDTAHWADMPVARA